MTRPPAGAVLTGGSSRRMGRDKALILIDGIPMAERVAAALVDGGCDPVIFVGGNAASLRSIGRPWHPDRWPGDGPLGGLITALSVLGRDCIVTACDLADLDGASVAAVIDVAAVTDADAVVARTDRIEPLLAWWRAELVDHLLARFDVGTRALHDVLAELAVAEVDVDAARLRNVNAPGDLTDRIDH